VDIVHGSLPAVRVPANFDAHGASDDLVAETDADDADAVLGEHAGRVLDQRLDPWRVVKGVVSLIVKVSIYRQKREFVQIRYVSRL
jgi:hypothetical protein